MGKRKSSAIVDPSSSSHGRTPESLNLRAARRAEVELEKQTRTCSCPAWQPHEASCVAGQLAQANAQGALDRIDELAKERVAKAKAQQALDEVQRGVETREKGQAALDRLDELAKERAAKAKAQQALDEVQRGVEAREKSKPEGN